MRSASGFVHIFKLAPSSSSIDDANETVRRFWRTTSSEDPSLPVLSSHAISRTDRRPIPFVYALMLLEAETEDVQSLDAKVLGILELLLKHDATSTSLQLHEVLRFSHRQRQAMQQSSLADKHQRHRQLHRYACFLWRCMLEVFTVKTQSSDMDVFIESTELELGAKSRCAPCNSHSARVHACTHAHVRMMRIHTCKCLHRAWMHAQLHATMLVFTCA